MRGSVGVCLLVSVNPLHLYRFCKEKAPMFSCGRKGVLLNSTVLRAVSNHGCFLLVIIFLPNFGKEPGGLAGECLLKFI